MAKVFVFKKVLQCIGDSSFSWDIGLSKLTRSHLMELDFRNQPFLNILLSLAEFQHTLSFQFNSSSLTTIEKHLPKTLILLF